MLKRIVLVFSSGLLKITLFSLALTGAGWMVFGTPDKIKKAADGSGIYSSTVDNILETAKDKASKENAKLPLEDPEIEAAAKEAFPPELLSRNSEAIINGFYTWLRGDSESPQFAVDLNGAKQEFANGVADYAQKRYESLPPCTFAQLQSMDTDIDVFSVNCRPPGLLGSTVREQVHAEIVGSDEFLETTEFTADNLPVDEQGRTITENLESAPDAYNIFRIMPWILAVLSALLAAVVLFMHDNRRKGLKSIGVSLINTGVSLIIGVLLLNLLLNSMNQPADAFQASIASIFKALGGDFSSALMRFYVVYIATGGSLLLALWLKNRKNTALLPKARQK